MKPILFFLLIAPVLAWAENNANINDEIQRLEQKLMRVQQETQATYERYQMIQEMRRNDVYSLPPTVPPEMSAKSVPYPMYEDWVRREQEKHERIQEYNADLDRLYQYHKELEEKRKLITEEINQLEQNQSSASGD